MKKIFSLLTIGLLLLLVGCKPTPVEEPVEKELGKVEKVLVIGNSFSHNSLEYLYPILDENIKISNGVVVGHIHIGGSSLETHSINAQTDSKAYQYDKYIKGKEKPAFPHLSIKQVLEDEEWDVVTIQQVSGKSGVLSSYHPHLKTLVDYIKENSLNKKVKVVWHMTWAYQSDSKHEDFENYANNQQFMYENIVEVTNNSPLKNPYIHNVIPTGTTIQNLRTSIIGDKLTVDGYHLNKIGKYAAALTWGAYLFNIDFSNYTIIDEEIPEEFSGAIVESVLASIEKPFEITPSVKYPWVEGTRYMERLNILAIGNSFTADAYKYFADMALDIGIEEFVIAYLYRGGTSLQFHLGALTSNNPAYSYRKWVKGKGYEVREDTTIEYGLADHEWDIITVQQVSQDSGDPNTIDPALTTILREIKKRIETPDTKIGYHMTWAYSQETGHSGFARYGSDQIKMYEAIVNTTQTKVVTNPGIDFIIPSGTAIQNARTTIEMKGVSDIPTGNDGYHLNEFGKYIAGLMWIKQITNIDVKKVKYYPTGVGVGTYLEQIRTAVENAYINPFEITNE